jgi:hypothetical protein
MWQGLGAQGVDTATAPVAGTKHLAWTPTPLTHLIVQPRDGTESPKSHS